MEQIEVTGVSWLDNRVANKHLFCICDFETTGTDPDTDYPIELGCIFTNQNFDIVGLYSDLIFNENMRMMVNWDQLGERAEEAYKIHKIPFTTVQHLGIDYRTVAERVDNLVRDLKLIYQVNKVIILSDNAQFEYRFMKKLFGKTKFPFHYSAWDSSLYLSVSGVGDPKPVHRALPDAFALYKNIIRSLPNHMK